MPVHVTMRAVRGAPRFRAERAANVIRDEIRRATAKGLRVLHFSIQENHLHLIVEANDGDALSRGAQRLASRVALSLNFVFRRRGRLWHDRYHRRDLATPRQFRNALVYVLFNARKHAQGDEAARLARVIDGCSSAMWIDTWAPEPRRDLLELVRAARAGPSPVAQPKTWIASRGWRRHGLLRPDETPRSPG